MTNLPTPFTWPEDLAGMVGWVGGTNERALVVGRDNYEFEPGSTRVHRDRSGRLREARPIMKFKATRLPRR
jgi:hypothetical protein